jgi:hypothetical protein
MTRLVGSFILFVLILNDSSSELNHNNYDEMVGTQQKKKKTFFGLLECGKSEMIARHVRTGKKAKFSVAVARLGHLQMDIEEWRRKNSQKNWSNDFLMILSTAQPSNRRAFLLC